MQVRVAVDSVTLSLLARVQGRCQKHEPLHGFHTWICIKCIDISVDSLIGGNEANEENKMITYDVTWPFTCNV